MAFDFNEARQMIEDAKKRGLIRTSDSAAPDSQEHAPKAKPGEKTTPTILPDWLREGMK